MELRVDGLVVSVPPGATVLEACDRAGRYVPRLCFYPSLGCACCSKGAAGAGGDVDGCLRDDADSFRCGLCAVQIPGPDHSPEVILACCTRAEAGMEIVTESPALQAERLDRLAELLGRHPHICLTCPDRDGCTRAECTFGIAAEARCCAEFGRCEFGRLVAYVDAREEVPRRPVAASRKARQEGRIRREPGLCLGCGRCVAVCATSSAAGDALHMVLDQRPREARVAMPKKGTLRASGCTFCGQCVMVCPSGAVTAPGEEGARWLESWRRRTQLPLPVLPPDRWRSLTDSELAAVPHIAGVFLLAGPDGEILQIAGVPDLCEGLCGAIIEPGCSVTASFRIEPAPLYTQRESELLARFSQDHGHLPPANDLGDDLYSDEESPVDFHSDPVD